MTNILLLNKVESLHKHIRSSKLNELIETSIHQNILAILLKSAYNYNTEQNYNDKLEEMQFNIYAILYYMKVCLKNEEISFDKEVIKIYENYLLKTLKLKINLNSIRASDTVGMSSSHTSGNKRWKTTGKKYFSASPLKLKKPSIKQNSLPLLTKKEKILQTIKSKCINMIDPITQQDFTKFPIKKLDYLIYIQSTIKYKYHCFYVKSLYAAMNSAIQSDEVFKNPLNKVEFSKEDKQKIMTTMKIIYPAIEIPRKKILYRDDIEIITDDNKWIDGIQYINIQVYYYLDIEYHNVFHILKDISIPLHIDERTSPSCTASAILIKIKEIITKGKLMSLTIPFTFHPAFESNIYADEWFDRNTNFNMIKYNAFCAML
jgi:hypothetical protein